MNTNILICGVGGQGIILTSKLIAATAMAQDIPVMSAETIGMAQKGGAVCSFLRLGEGLYGPLFPEGAAGLLLAFEPAEAVRMLPYLKPGGLLIVNSYPIMPPTAALAGSDYTGQEMLDYLKRNVERLTVVDGDEACRSLGSPKALNMVMLGAALMAGAFPFSVDEVDAVMRQTVDARFHDLNSRALRYQ